MRKHPGPWPKERYLHEQAGIYQSALRYAAFRLQRLQHPTWGQAMSRRSPAGRVSLRFELGTLCDAIDGARVLGDLARHRNAESPTAERSALAGASAVLSLVTQRLRMLDAVIAGEVETAHLAAAHNAIDDDLEDGDIVLPITGKRR